MKKIVHDTFTIERNLDAPRDRVFEALANPEIKAKWFAVESGWKVNERTQDFRVGGKDHVSGTFLEKGITSIFDAHYLDIVPNERVVYTYEMTVNGRKISTSLATFEFVDLGKNKTGLVLTEQGAYYEDPEMKKYAPQGQHASRLEGTKILMDRFAKLFEQ